MLYHQWNFAIHKREQNMKQKSLSVSTTEFEKLWQWNWDRVKNCVLVSDYIYSAYSAGTSLLVEGSFHSFVNKGWKGSVLRGFSLALASCCVLLIIYLSTNQAFAITGNDSWFFIVWHLIVCPLVFIYWSLLIEIHFTFQVKAKVFSTWINFTNCTLWVITKSEYAKSLMGQFNIFSSNNECPCPIITDLQKAAIL